MTNEPIIITPDFVWPESDTHGNRTLANGAVIEQYASIEQCAVIGRGAVIRRNASIGPGAVIGPYASIEPYAVIEQGAVIRRNASIGQGAVIGPYASIEQCAVIGRDAVIEQGAVIGQWARIGRGARVGPNARWIACVGFADGYYKDLCAVGDVAYIGAGCRWFTLGEALRHWENHPEERQDTLDLMKSAVAMAERRGLKREAA